ncbi:30S ribosomal protein S16 [Candidatus Jorgensenbacteria bacterium RIFCSPLOWO2_01_FULL_45_25b]|uniref:Small ribosomal subunit protein bS16 n=1 Tax=Candidatus Jorgensenbacteria bacterium RIFCSPLOWO2_01_FULL_45_25b TaxID=1798471 RepID=A0A1F6BU93_9BACT|nr:MAG: 30S ribosomal protein S16 [Candidatus Jorgensenbacteria bacterium RIFCSPLOWO2_01_FULL_45_25b]
MLAIKFKKTGKKHQHYLRLIVAEKKSKLTGRSVDDIGWANPHENTHEINKERVQYWITKGAKPTEGVHNLLVKAGAIKARKVAVHKKSKKTETPKAE